MPTATSLFLGLLVLAVIYILARVRAGAHELLKFWGKMLVTCPETRHTAAVQVAGGRAALMAAVGHPHLTLSQCSRWPKREGCDQACLSQLRERSPGQLAVADCLAMVCG